MQKWIIFIIVGVIIILTIFLVCNFDIETEYIPENEISETDLRKTLVSLYFEDSESKTLEKESRLIDSKVLLREPCKELLEMLKGESENSNYKSTFPEGTEILGVSILQNVATVNLSAEFVENSTDSFQRVNSIKAIVYTLTELKEVDEIKILINGEEIEGFTSEGIDFKENITKSLLANL